MKAIVSVIGKDKTGIIAKVSTALSQYSVNIEDISQTIMQDYFTMIMLVDISGFNQNFSTLAASLENLGESIGVNIRIQHEDIFSAMHKI